MTKQINSATLSGAAVTQYERRKIMRYYNFALTTNSEQIEKNSKVKLRDYAYDSTICAVNLFMYKNLKNNLYFLIYREEENRVLAAFSYDEKQGSFDDSYNMILEMLRDNFCINKVQSEPCEITMFQFIDCMNETRRNHRGRKQQKACHI